MPIMDRLDPELAAVVSQLPIMDLRDIPAARAAMAELYAQVNVAEPNPSVTHSDHSAPGAQGDPDVMIRVFRPAGTDDVLPCLYWIQGGGYVMTAPDMDDQYCEEIADRHHCVVVSVDWRRAPEHPFPAPAGLFCCFRGSVGSYVCSIEGQAVRPGRGGQQPPLVSMAMAMSASGEWNP